VSPLSSALRLLTFMLLSALLIFTTQWITRDRIEENQYNQRMARIIPLARSLTASQSPLLSELEQYPLVVCSNEGGALILDGWILRVSTEGYAGTIELLAAVNREFKITATAILSHRETPGIGDFIEPERSPWMSQFHGYAAIQTGNLALVRDGGEIDARTGATITSRALTHAFANLLTGQQAPRSCE